MNIIPIIAKSDAISKSELTKFKIKITSELVSNGVQIYQFPTDDESVAEINGTMNVSDLVLPPLPEHRYQCRGLVAHIGMLLKSTFPFILCLKTRGFHRDPILCSVILG